MGVDVIDARGSLEDLNHGLLSVDLQNLTPSDGPVSQDHVDYLGVFGELDIVQYDQRSVDLQHSSVVDPGCDIIVSYDCLNMGLIHYKYILMQGKIFADRYKVQVKIGSGAFGELWSADNTMNKQRVAIKFEDVDLKKQTLFQECQVYMWLMKQGNIKEIGLP
jgi:hypothetical protein